MTNPMLNATIATRSRAASTNSSNNGVIEPITTTTSLDVSDDANTSADDINDSASGKISATTTTNINSSNMDLDTANMKSLADLDLDNFMDVTEVLHNFKVETNALIIKLVVATSAKNKDINMVNSLHQEVKSRQSVLKTILEAQNLTSDSDKESDADNNGDKRSTVPNNMPLFKWNTATNSDTGFNSLKECLMRFEDILNAHDLKLDTHWRRLIVYCLSVEQRAWLDDFVLDNANTAILYHDFKAAFIQNYGITTAEEQALASNILMTICMEPNESIEVFIERFIQLKRQAATVDPTILISRFINALPVELSNQVTFILTGASDTNKRSLIYVMSLAKDLYTKLFQFSNNLNMLNSSNNGSSSRQHLTGRQNNLYEGHVAKKRPITNSNTCILHKNGRHTSEECHTLKAATSNLNKNGNSNSEHRPPPPTNRTFFANNRNQNDQPRRCFQCDFTPWTKDHVCATNNANEQPLLTFRSMTRINNTRPTTFPTPPPNVDEDMEMDDPEESFDKFSKS